jgi:hypothetical protein
MAISVNLCTFDLAERRPSPTYSLVKPTFLCLLFALLLSMAPSGFAVVDDAHTFALEAATPYVQQGYAVREEHWAGWLAKGKQSSIQHQLFGGNDYWFWLASDEEAARLTVHIYDSKGNLVDAEAWSKGNMAGVRVQPKRSGAYYIVFQVEDTKLKRTRWAIAYGFK